MGELVSHAGNSWLRKAALRKRVDNMLDEWRHFYQREHETLADAIAHLTAGTDVAPAAMRVHTSILPARMAAIAPLERLVDEPSLDPETREKVMDALCALNRSKEAQG